MEENLHLQLAAINARLCGFTNTAKALESAFRLKHLDDHLGPAGRWQKVQPSATRPLLKGGRIARSHRGKVAQKGENSGSPEATSSSSIRNDSRVSVRCALEY